jgi:Ran GTPase-activating protein (RanGAP) involved in mRNA processing and transport
LAKVKHIEKINLGWCNLTADDIPHIAAALSNMPQLVELDLSDNETLDGSGEAWLHLAKVKHIEKINFYRCKFRADDIPHIATALSNMPKLVELDLSLNWSLGGSGEAWSHLAKVKHIEKINLRWCYLTADDIPHIAAALSNMPQLVELDLSFNWSLGGSGEAWSHLAKVKHIEKVNLASCGLTAGDIPHIAAALSKMPKLVELDLYCNVTLGGSGEAWSHLAKVKQIEKVNLKDCSLKADDIPHIAAALSKMPKLVELDLSCNVTLAGSGEAWSHLARY